MSHPHSIHPAISRLVRSGAASLGLSVTGALTLYAVGRAAGWLAPSVTTGPGASGDVPGLIAVLGMAMAAPIVATAIFGLLARFAPRPGAIFLAVAASVFVGFLPGPILLNVPIATTVLLEAMHLAVAVPIVVHMLGTLSSQQPAPELATA